VVTGRTGASDSAVSPDGRWILFLASEGGRPRAYVQAFDGSDSLIPIAHADGQARTFTWSPNGRELAYVLPHDAGAFVQIIPAFFGGPARASIEVDASADILRWVGDDLYLSGRDAGQPSLHALHLDTATVQPIPLDWIGPGTLSELDVSPDGRRVAYTTSAGGRQDLWVANLDGSGRRRLTDDDAFERHIRWRPPGSVVYQSNRGGQANLWESDVATGITTPLTTTDSTDIPGGSSADGSVVSYTRQSVDAQLWQWQSGLSGRALTVGTLGSFSPTVSPDGRTLLFQRGQAIEQVGSQILDSSLMASDLQPDAIGAPRLLARGFAGVLSPEGRWLAFLTPADGRSSPTLALKELSSGRTLTVTAEGSRPAFRGLPIDWAEQLVAWHPDATSVFYVDGVIPSPLSLRRFDLATGRAGDPLDTGGSREFFRDLYPSADGRRLGYLHWSQGTFTLRVADLETGTHRELARLAGGVSSAFGRGWLADDETFVLLLRGPARSDGSADVDVLLTNGYDAPRAVQTLTSAFITTIRLDVSRRLVFATRSVDDVHNVFSVPFGGGAYTAITANASEDTTFSRVTVSPGGGVIGVRATRTQDIWILETQLDARTPQR
jgi:dipeptidyl aminopeptidase/acylaminoacyl peptidase